MKLFMRKILRWFSAINPFVFAIAYLITILVAATLLHLSPVFELTSSLDGVDLKGWFTSFYFSLITITTLGYGDILPANETTRVLASSLAFSGIVLTGLFLNSLAFRISEITQFEDKAKFDRDQHSIQVQRFKDISSLLELDFENFKYAANSLITPMEKYELINDFNRLLKLDFKINDLKDMFKPNPMRRFSFAKSRIELYYEVLGRLNKNLDDLLKLGYFNFNTQIMKQIAIYLNNSKICDSSGYILYANSSHIERESDREMLEKAKEDVRITEISNVIDDYIVLMEQIKLTVSLILNVEDLISSID